MPNQTVKNGLKAKKIKLPQMIFFFRKTTNKIFMYLLVPFILQNFKKFLGPIQSYEDVPFLGPKWPTSHEQNFFGTNHYYYFHLLTSPFHCEKFLKFFYSKSRVMRMCNFRAQNTPICPEQNFLVQTIITFIYLLALFIGQNLKKILTAKCSICPKQKLLCNFKKFVQRIQS